MIVIVYPQFYGVGGIARYLDSFLSNLPSPLDEDVVLITGTEGMRAVSYPGVEIIHVPMRAGRLSLVVWSWQVRQLLIRMKTEEQLTAVNLHWPPLLPGLFLPSGIPLVLTVHTTYIGMSGRYYAPNKYYESQWGGLSIFIKIMMEKFILKRTNKIIALTAQGKKELGEYGFDRQIDVIPNGADLETFKPSPSEKQWDVIFSGRIESRKGSRTIPKVCEALIQIRPDVRILIVGYGDDDAHVASSLKDYAANVTMTGKIPFAGMVDRLRKSKVYVSTSYYEGLPGTCLEAMAMGLPAVVWDLEFYHNLVIDGKNGAVVRVDDVQTMAMRIDGIIKNDVQCAEMGRSARKTIEDGYDWGALSKNVLGSVGLVSDTGLRH